MMRHRRFSRKGSREQTLWFRTGVNGQTPVALQLTTAAPTQPTTIFQGSAVDAGLDQRLTIRRVHLNLTWNRNNVTDNDLCFNMIVLKTFTGAPTPSAILAASSDQTNDLLYQRTFPLGLGVSGNTAPQSLPIDIKSNRKVTEKDTLTVVYTMFRASLGAIAAGQIVDLALFASVLFQRTRR
jgi:hypothetical protein